VRGYIYHAHEVVEGGYLYPVHWRNGIWFLAVVDRHFWFYVCPLNINYITTDDRHNSPFSGVTSIA
jgi:hypothetical protein